jgi:serine/threonine-protein kinase
VNTPSSRPGGAASLIGTVVGGRYKLERVIGEGGMSAVYEGEHVHMHKPVAVKVLSPEMSKSSEAVERFHREAMAASRIDHPNVAAATDFGELEDKSFFLVLELISGKTLRDAVREGKFPVRRTLHVARQIGSALARAHALNIVHRDLKPENVMLTSRAGDEDFVKILDFGIAKLPVKDLAPDATPSEAAPLTQLGMVYGTPEYMSPEQAMGKPIDARADLYSLGVIMFEMLAGVRPWDDENKAVLLGKHVSQPIPTIAERSPDAGTPEDVEAIVRKLMAKSPDDRYAKAEDATAAIDAILARPPQPVVLPGQAFTVPLPAAQRLVKPPLAERVKALPAHALARAKALLDRVEPRLPLDKIPLKIPPRQKLYAVMGAAAFVLLLVIGGFILVLSLVFRSTESKKDTTTAASVDHRAKVQAAAQAGDYASVVREAAIFAAGPHSDKDADEVARSVEAASAAQEDAAFELMEHKLGAAGVDALYDLAYGAPSQSAANATLTARAKKSLQDDGVKSKMSPALTVTLNIKTTQDICAAKTKYFSQAASVGDARTEAALTPYLKKGGCGRRGRVDCHPCLRSGDDSVEKTVAAIRARGDAGTPQN